MAPFWFYVMFCFCPRLYGATVICYHAFYLPLLYENFLADFFQVVSLYHSTFVVIFFQKNCLFLDRKDVCNLEIFINFSGGWFAFGECILFGDEGCWFLWHWLGVRMAIPRLVAYVNLLTYIFSVLQDAGKNLEWDLCLVIKLNLQCSMKSLHFSLQRGVCLWFIWGFLYGKSVHKLMLVGKVNKWNWNLNLV